MHVLQSILNQGFVYFHCNNHSFYNSFFVRQFQLANDGPESVCVKDILLELRNYRMGLIQTVDQLKFSYMAIVEGRFYYLILSDVLITILFKEVFFITNGYIVHHQYIYMTISTFKSVYSLYHFICQKASTQFILTINHFSNFKSQSTQFLNQRCSVRPNGTQTTSSETI